MLKLGMLFVQGKDRPGIISAVTGALFEAGANLEDVSMTLLEGQFAMMLSFDLKNFNLTKLARTMKVFEKKPWNLNVSLIVVPRIHPKNKSAARSSLITAIGKDRAGLVYHVSSGLAKMKANITSLDSRLLHRRNGQDLYSLALAVDFKKPGDIKLIEKLIARWKSKLGIEVKVHSAEAAIF